MATTTLTPRRTSRRSEETVIHIQRNLPTVETEPADFTGLLDTAQDPATPPGTLWELFDATRSGLGPKETQTLSEALARHPNAPVDLLATLAYRCPKAVAQNPALPLLPLEYPDLLDHIPAPALPGLLACPELPPAFVALCRRYPDREIAELAARHIAFAPLYDAAGTTWQEEAREEIVRLPVGDWEALWELIEHDCAPQELAERLGFAALHAPVHPEVRDFIERRHDASASPPALPDVVTPPPGSWEALVQYDFSRALECASDPRTPPDALRRILRYQPNPIPPGYDRRALGYRIVHNIATPPDVLADCRDQNTAPTIAAHPNADAKLLRLVLQRAEEVMISDARYLDVLCAALSNPATPRDVLQEALSAARRNISLSRPELRPAAALFRRLLRWHPALVTDPPQFPATNDPFEPPMPLPGSQAFVLYLSVARSPLLTIPPTHPESVANDGAWSTRFAAALNPYVPDEMRDALCEDGHCLVRTAARARRAAPAGIVCGVPGDAGRDWAV
jgi:hypothetical protein